MRGYSFSLRASSPGRAGKRRRACNYVSGIWIPPPIPLWLFVDWSVRFPPITAKPKQGRMKTNIEKHVIRVTTSLIVLSPPICVSHQIFKFQRRSCKFSFLFPPCLKSAPPGELARRLVFFLIVLPWEFIYVIKTSQLYILKTRLCGEIYSSDVNMHKGYSLWWRIRGERLDHVTQSELAARNNEA